MRTTPAVGTGLRQEVPALSAGDSAPIWRRGLLWTALAAGLVAASFAGVAGLRWFSQRTPEPTQPLIYHTATAGDLPITVTERGNLESQNNIEILCEVDDIEGDGVVGTQIISIVPNGTSVKKGELLVEFDSAKHRERLDRQILDTESARAVQIQAQAKYDNQITQNETLLADALLDVELAKLEQEMFVDKDSGTHKLEVEAIERLVEDINNEILGAKGTLELKRNEQRGIEALFKLGYAGKHQLDQSVLDLLQAESQYVAKINKLNTQLATLKKKQTYEKQMEELTLQGKKDTADRQVEQVKRNAEALLAQAKAALDAANEHLKKEEERLVRYTRADRQVQDHRAPGRDGRLCGRRPLLRRRDPRRRVAPPPAEDLVAAEPVADAGQDLGPRVRAGPGQDRNCRPACASMPFRNVCIAARSSPSPCCPTRAAGTARTPRSTRRSSRSTNRWSV